MITDQTYQKDEAEMKQIFAQAGWHEIPAPNEIRINRIEERALSERVSKEATDFIFTSFGTVLASFTSAAFGQIEHATEDYKV